MKTSISNNENFKLLVHSFFSLVESLKKGGFGYCLKVAFSTSRPFEVLFTP
jgi:hypothetical protein